MTTGSSTDKTVTLPTAADPVDREINVLKADSGTNYIDYLGIQQETITVELQGRGVKVKSNGVSWDVIEVIGADIESISSVLELIYTKSFLGSSAASPTSIAHGVDYDKILSTDMQITDGAGYKVYDYRISSSAAVGFTLTVDSTNIVAGSVGANLIGNPYRATIKYYI
jgi:hypothetical protein